MKKYLIVLLAATLSFTIASCGSNTNKKQEPAAAQSSANETKGNGATPSNINDLLENYTGTFEGIVPCADCSGIDTKLTLNGDYTYALSATYQGKGEGNTFESTGKWKINEGLDIITLDFDKPQELTYYKIVNVNTIQMLDKDGKVINSSHNYDLTR